MCSIFGAIGNIENEESYKEAFDSLAHRGIDGSDFIKDTDYFFGNHRLAIQSYNLPQNQPLIKDNFIALFNGEIYNYKELIDSYNLNANDEIETILELFKTKGANFIHKLRGMFAIAIYAKDSNELWLFRDMVGKKPLFFTFQKQLFVFSSETTAINKLFGLNLQKRNIHKFLGFGATIAPITLNQNIYKLEPGSYLHFKDKEINISCWEEILKSKIEHTTLKSASAALEKYMSEAINLRVPKGLKWGVLLSGGLDSSLVASIASRQSKEKIECFSIGYDGYEKYDERIYAKEVATHINANLTEVNFTKKEFFDTLDEIIDIIDEPIGDPAQVPLYFLIKQARKNGIKVMLSGDGSDELFLGYKTYKEYYMMEKVKELPYANWLKNHLKSNFSLNKEWEWYKRALKDEVVFRSSAEIYTDRQLNRLLRLQERDNKNFETLQRYWDEFGKSGRDIIDWYSYCDLKVQLAEFFLVKLDRVSMANSVEVRSPFLDKKIVELAFKIDPKIRFNKENVKEVVKEAAKDYLPYDIINRKKKGLNYPFIEWILEENGIEQIYIANEKFNFLRKDHLDFLCSKASQGKFKQHLFPLFILSKWLLKDSK